MEVSLQLEMNDAMRQLMELAGGGWKKAAARAINKTALQGEALIAESTPVQTSNLKNSIKHTRATPDNRQAVIYSNVIYAPYVEYGVGQLTDWPGGSSTPDVRGFAPRAMFRRNMGQIETLLLQNLRREIERLGAE